MSTRNFPLAHKRSVRYRGMMSASSNENDPWPLGPLRKEDLHEGTKTLIHGVSVLLVVFWVSFSFALLFRTALVLLNIDLGVEWLAPTSDRWKDIQYSLIALTALLLAPAVVWRTLIASNQTRIQQQTHYSDMFAKAVDQLGARTEAGDANIEVRLGGIYALQRIAEESERDYLPIVKTLSAYVRQNPDEELKMPTNLPPEPDWDAAAKRRTAANWTALRDQSEIRAQAIRTWGEKLRERAKQKGAGSAHRQDIRAALEVLETRSERWRQLEGGEQTPPPQPPPELSDDTNSKTNAPAKTIQRCASTYRRRMEEWRVRPDAPDLESTTLPGINHLMVKLSRFNLREAAIQGADLSWGEMQGVNLSRALLQGADFSGTEMQGADLRWARMQGAVLEEAQMDGATLIAARLQGANFSGAQMQGAHLMLAWMQGADFGGAEMQGADFSSARMQGADLGHAKLLGADFFQSQMQGADLGKAQMQGANFFEANMRETNLRGARLNEAILRGVALKFVETDCADFTDSLIVSVDFTGSTIAQDQLDSAFGDASTAAKLPKGLAVPDHWSKDDLSHGWVETERQWKAWLASRSA